MLTNDRIPRPEMVCALLAESGVPVWHLEGAEAIAVRPRPACRARRHNRRELPLPLPPPSGPQSPKRNHLPGLTTYVWHTETESGVTSTHLQLRQTDRRLPPKPPSEDFPFPPCSPSHRRQTLPLAEQCGRRTVCRWSCILLKACRASLPPDTEVAIQSLGDWPATCHAPMQLSGGGPARLIRYRRAKLSSATS